MCVNAIAWEIDTSTASIFAAKLFMNFFFSFRRRNFAINSLDVKLLHQFTSSFRWDWYQILNNRYDNYTTMQLSEWFRLEINLAACWEICSSLRRKTFPNAPSIFHSNSLSSPQHRIKTSRINFNSCDTDFNFQNKPCHCLQIAKPPSAFFIWFVSWRKTFLDSFFPASSSSLEAKVCEIPQNHSC